MPRVGSPSWSVCYALLIIDYIEFLQWLSVAVTLTQNDKLAYFQQSLVQIRSQISWSKLACGINGQTTPKEETVQRQMNLLCAQFIRAKPDKSTQSSINLRSPNTFSKQDVHEIPNMPKRNSSRNQWTSNTKERDLSAKIEPFAYTIYQGKVGRKNRSLVQLSIATKKNNKLIISIN